MHSNIKSWPILVLFILPTLVCAQQQEIIVEPLPLNNIFAYITTIVVAFVALAAIYVIYKAMDVMVRQKELELYKENGLEDYILAHERNLQSTWWQRVSRQMTGAVAIEKEDEILMNHDYDGIRELDNDLPPWWLYGFYLTIIISIIYIFVQHFTDYGKSSAEEYEIEIATAKIEVEKYLSTQANLVDESNVTLLEDEVSLAEGKTIFNDNCSVCHLESGGGSPNSVGPNLTDKYWLHGGSIVDVFKTIKYGVPEKGMISWKTQLRPADMHKVASYILSLQGTNPENARAPQGELYIADVTEKADSSALEVEQEGHNE